MMKLGKNTKPTLLENSEFKQSQNHKQLFETENIESEIVSRCKLKTKKITVTKYSRWYIARVFALR